MHTSAYIQAQVRCCSEVRRTMGEDRWKSGTVAQR